MKLNHYPPPRIELDRLTIRGIEDKDAKGIFSIRNNLDMIEYSGVPQMTDLKEADKFVETRIDGMKENKWFYWIIADEIHDTLMGTICLFNFDEKVNSCDIGYEILPDYSGNGYVADAMEAIIKFAFEDLKIGKIYADINPENIRSINVVIRSGFNFEKVLDNGYKLHCLVNEK